MAFGLFFPDHASQGVDPGAPKEAHPTNHTLSIVGIQGYESHGGQCFCFFFSFWKGSMTLASASVDVRDFLWHDLYFIKFTCQGPHRMNVKNNRGKIRIPYASRILLESRQRVWLKKSWSTINSWLHLVIKHKLSLILHRSSIQLRAKWKTCK
jgi:hypothetical protein